MSAIGAKNLKLEDVMLKFSRPEREEVPEAPRTEKEMQAQALSMAAAFGAKIKL